MDDAPFSRRDFLGALAGGAMVACGMKEPSVSSAPDPSRLSARPVATPTTPRRAFKPGLDALATDDRREVLLYVPSGYTPDRPTPLAVALHGAGQTARIGITPLQTFADAAGLLLVAPQSVGRTWDFLGNGYGADVAALDRTLAQLFRDCSVDPARVALTGFSDGASYALSLGLTNGDLFTRLVAFSPCIVSPTATRGQPPIFISHGTRDGILAIDGCSRRIVPALRNAGYTVTYREFDGPHAVPSDIASEAANFITS